MFDLLIQNARLRTQTELTDIGITGDRIAAVGPNLPAAAVQVVNAEGRLVSPPLIEPHCHLDAALTAGLGGHNESGTLLEGIELWAAIKKSFTPREIKDRALKAIKWYVSQGTLQIRSHVDICDPALIGLQVLLELREEVRDLVDIQLVAFPQEGVGSFPNGAALLEEALRLGCDAVGAIPHFETTREMGVESLQIAFGLAEKYDRLIDVHCDETDDEQSRFVEVMAAETIRRDLGSRVTASHTAAMHSYNNAYAFKLFGWLHRAGLNIVANPPDNIILQGRFDTYPKRRGMTRVKELLAAGINVAVGHDSLMDPFYPLGTGNMLHAAFLALHVAQMSGHTEISQVWDLITTNAAQVLDISADYGVMEGKRADLIIMDAETDHEALRTVAPCLVAVKNGRIIMQSAPVRRCLLRCGREEIIRLDK